MEGPSLVILHEELQAFVGQKVIKVSGNTKQPKDSLRGRKLEKIETWGKVLFLFFTAGKKQTIVTRTHFLMFGSYTINQAKEERTPRLRLDFKNGTVYFYACSIRFGGPEMWAELDSSVDIMSNKWSLEHVLEKMKSKPKSLLCDLFLDQGVFAGSGNIVKNEVLFNVRCHPQTRLSEISAKDRPKLAEAIRSYGFDFYRWKKKFELRQHWQVYRKSVCPLCGRKLKREKIGKFERWTFYCPLHQARKAKKNLKVHPVLPLKRKAEREPVFEH